MFTGIIAAVGRLVSTQHHGTDQRICLHTGSLDMTDVKLGDSIAANGICLTVIEQGADYFMADVSHETLSCTTLQHWTSGTRVNLEKALQLSDRLGGHLVSGHVDGVGHLIERQAEGRSQRLSFQAPTALSRYIAVKGSISIDGVSLTVNTSPAPVFTVNIVPHTLKETTLDQLQIGQAVNLEVDLIARYLERLWQIPAPTPAPSLTLDLLQQHGFIRD